VCEERAVTALIYANAMVFLSNSTMTLSLSCDCTTVNFYVLS